jgi:hypothetical protein
MIARIKLWLAPPVPTPAERLAATLRPDPESRSRRLSQMDSARRRRYFDAAYGEPQSLRRRR